MNELSLPGMHGTLYLPNMKPHFLIFCFCNLVSAGFSQNRQLYERQLFIQEDDTLQCRILSPIDFSDKKKYPLLVFMHGSGERGSDNESQLTWGADLFLDSMNRLKYPAFILFPQCPADSSWSLAQSSPGKDSLGFIFRMDAPPRQPLRLLLNFIDTLVKSGRVDPSRIYVGGLSMGGFGTYETLWRRPNLFAAAFVICGGGNPAGAKLYAKGLPIWIFHGSSDPAVPVANSRLMYGTLKNDKARVKYTEYPGVGHDSWKNAFAEHELLPWLFSQRKK